jgi:NAD(P)-dependent dehydrogenase (short-subunit alcohol dehydrogenase family)
MRLLEGKVGLVTGAGVGIGRATAIMFAKEGAKVTVAERDEPSGRETVQLIEAAGGSAIFCKTDVAIPEDVEAMVQATVETFGALHCASNNAAVAAGFHLLTDLKKKAWDGSISVNLTGVWLCMKYEVPAMLASGGGAIVNIASSSALKGEALQAAYSAGKGGVVALTKTAAAEYAQRGIRVNAVCPGGVRTPGIDHYFRKNPDVYEKTVATHAMRRLAEPEEIADAVTYLCSDRASFITGHALLVDGGAAVNPHAL